MRAPASSRKHKADELLKSEHALDGSSRRSGGDGYAKIVDVEDDWDDWDD
jgi:hypothetical protein